MNATAIVAEDEPTLRQQLVEQLGQLWPELTIVAEAGDGIAALRLMGEHRPDILFLDIQMPGATGLEVARQVNGRSRVVFVTAYDEHAVAAFEQGAIDYVLKPISAARLFTTVTRLKERLGSPAPRLDHVLPAITPAGAQKNYLRWINASVGQNLRLITVAPSLGGPETLISAPVATSHAGQSEAELRRAGISDSLLRLSIGLEAPQDIIGDLQSALPT